MRHLVANIVTYAIAALLFLGAAAFAWLRTEQITLADERLLLARHVPAADEFRWRELGVRGYARNCANCHGPAGEGRDQYPPLDSAAAFAMLPGGREYLIDLTLFGLTSERWKAPMPRMKHIQDVEIAALLNHVAASFGGRAPDPPLGPMDVARRRGQQLSPAEVNGRRPQVTRVRY